MLHRNQHLEKLLTVFHIRNLVDIDAEGIKQFFAFNSCDSHIAVLTMLTDKLGNLLNTVESLVAVNCVDELSYLTFNRYQSEMLFQIISERSERASVIISTNLEFSEWTQLFENEMMLAALIDRVTFRSFVLNMNCSSSYRIDATINNV